MNILLHTLHASPRFDYNTHRDTERVERVTEIDEKPILLVLCVVVRLVKPPHKNSLGCRTLKPMIPKVRPPPFPKKKGRHDALDEIEPERELTLSLQALNLREESAKETKKRTQKKLCKNLFKNIIRYIY